MSIAGSGAIGESTGLPGVAKSRTLRLAALRPVDEQRPDLLGDSDKGERGHVEKGGTNKI